MFKLQKQRCWYHDPSFGLVTKVRVWKGSGQKCNRIITPTFSRVWKSVREWPHTLPSGLPLWELEYLWTPKFSENDLKGQNSLDWRLPYNIRNILRLICLKWVLMIHLSTYNTSYGWKKGWKSKCQFDFWPLKVRNCPELCVCRWHAIYC
jgi:hypothetical protein